MSLEQLPHTILPQTIVLKENVAPMANALATVSALKPVELKNGKLMAGMVKVLLPMN